LPIAVIATLLSAYWTTHDDVLLHRNGYRKLIERPPHYTYTQSCILWFGYVLIANVIYYSYTFTGVVNQPM